MLEEWRQVVGFETLYEVSSLGRVKSFHKTVAKILSPSKANYGYSQVGLHDEQGPHTHGVHTLMLKAFVGPRPPGMFACHNDGDTSNNTLGNLRWDTQAENMKDMVRHGRFGEIRMGTANGEACWNSRLTMGDVRRIREASLFGARQCDLSKIYGVSIGAIKGVVNKTTWKHV